MKILIAEDETVTRLVLAATLRKLGHEVVAVENGRMAWGKLQQDDFALLISDWVMPEVDGLALCRLIRAEERTSYTYIILLTALEGKGSYLDGMDAGADDFITKPFDEAQLVARLRVAQRILDLHEVLRVAATHDRLTGLLNRGAILESLDQELSRAARDGSTVGVVLADLDHFKQVNDTYGHLTGDAVLREAAWRMRDALRSYDKIGRYGGEEFLIVLPFLPSIPSPGALEVAERIRQAISAAAVNTPGRMLSITVSLGLTMSQAAPKLDGNALIGVADMALYQAKAKGRNRVELAHQEP